MLSTSLLIVGALAIAQAAEVPSWTRARALATLAACERGVSTPGCTPFAPEAAEFLRTRYWRGDSALLEPLLRAGRRSDGALSEVLGTFYAEVLRRRPRPLLLKLQRLGVADADRVVESAATGDGSGLTEAEVAAILGQLTRLSSGAGRLNQAALRAKRLFHATSQRMAQEH